MDDQQPVLLRDIRGFFRGVFFRNVFIFKNIPAGNVFRFIGNQPAFHIAAFAERVAEGRILPGFLIIQGFCFFFQIADIHPVVVNFYFFSQQIQPDIIVVGCRRQP